MESDPSGSGAGSAIGRRMYSRSYTRGGVANAAPGETRGTGHPTKGGTLTVGAYGRERPSLALPALAAFAAAAAGGVVWGLIIKWTQYEVGFIAWAIGFLAATAAVLVAQRRSSTALQVIAVVAALAGILLGKYLSYALWGKDNGYDFGGMWGWFDALWIGLAVVTAWRVAQPEDESALGGPEAVEAREP